MRAAILSTGTDRRAGALEICHVPDPLVATGQCLLRVLACGVCRTDLHIVEGDLGPARPRLLPGHQSVGGGGGGAVPPRPARGVRAVGSWRGRGGERALSR